MRRSLSFGSVYATLLVTEFAVLAIFFSVLMFVELPLTFALGLMIAMKKKEVRGNPVIGLRFMLCATVGMTIGSSPVWASYGGSFGWQAALLSPCMPGAAFVCGILSARIRPMLLSLSRRRNLIAV